MSIILKMLRGQHSHLFWVFLGLLIWILYRQTDAQGDIWPCSAPKPCVVGRFYGDPENCTNYYVCSAGGVTIHRRSCSGNTQFCPGHPIPCPNLVNCSAPCEPPCLSTRRPPGGPCDEFLNSCQRGEGPTRYPDKWKCDVYHECVNGILVPRQCQHQWTFVNDSCHRINPRPTDCTIVCPTTRPTVVTTTAFQSSEGTTMQSDETSQGITVLSVKTTQGTTIQSVQTTHSTAVQPLQTSEGTTLQSMKPSPDTTLQDATSEGTTAGLAVLSTSKAHPSTQAASDGSTSPVAPGNRQQQGSPVGGIVGVVLVLLLVAAVVIAIVVFKKKRPSKVAPDHAKIILNG